MAKCCAGVVSLLAFTTRYSVQPRSFKCRFGRGRGGCVQGQVSSRVSFLQALTRFEGRQEQQRVHHPKLISTFPTLPLLPCPSVAVRAEALYGCHLCLPWPPPQRAPSLPFAVAWDRGFASQAIDSVFIMLPAWRILASLIVIPSPLPSAMAAQLLDGETVTQQQHLLKQTSQH